MTAASQPDHGPLARFRDVVADPNTMSIVVQRMADGETLKDIAKAWKVPYGKLCEWITEDRDRTEQFSNAQRFAAEALAQDVVAIADAATPETVAVQRLRIDARKWATSKWDRPKYGDALEHKHTGGISLISVLSGIPRGAEIDVTPEVLALEDGSKNTAQKKHAPQSTVPVSAEAEYI